MCSFTPRIPNLRLLYQNQAITRRLQRNKHSVFWQNLFLVHLFWPKCSCCEMLNNLGRIVLVLALKTQRRRHSQCHTFSITHFFGLRAHQDGYFHLKPYKHLFTTIISSLDVLCVSIISANTQIFFLKPFYRRSYV